MFMSFKHILFLGIFFGLTTHASIINITKLEKEGKVRIVACDLPVDYANLGITKKQLLDLLNNTGGSGFVIIKKSEYEGNDPLILGRIRASKEEYLKNNDGFARQDISSYFSEKIKAGEIPGQTIRFGLNADQLNYNIFNPLNPYLPTYKNEESRLMQIKDTLTSIHEEIDKKITLTGGINESYAKTKPGAQTLLALYGTAYDSLYQIVNKMATTFLEELDAFQKNERLDIKKFKDLARNYISLSHEFATLNTARFLKHNSNEQSIIVLTDNFDIQGEIVKFLTMDEYTITKQLGLHGEDKKVVEIFMVDNERSTRETALININNLGNHMIVFYSQKIDLNKFFAPTTAVTARRALPAPETPTPPAASVAGAGIAPTASSLSPRILRAAVLRATQTQPPTPTPPARPFIPAKGFTPTPLASIPERPPQPRTPAVQQAPPPPTPAITPVTPPALPTPTPSATTPPRQTLWGNIQNLTTRSMSWARSQLSSIINRIRSWF